MQRNLAFILGLLDRHYPAYVAQEDFEGEHGPTLKFWQKLGLLRKAPERQPTPSCPSCREGVPRLLAGRFLCTTCLSPVDRRHLLLWRFDLEEFLMWLTRGLKLNRDVRQIDETLWQLGSFSQGGVVYHCFFRRNGPLSDRGRQRLLTFHNALVLQGVSREPDEGFHGPCLSLLELLRQDAHSLKVTDLTLLLRSRGTVRFDEESGSLRVGDKYLGEVTLGSKEFHFLACLARHLNQFVSYEDLKRYVLRSSGSTDTTEEATFCQKLKVRIKKRISIIDSLLVTTNKGDGYRLRGQVEPWEG